VTQPAETVEQPPKKPLILYRFYDALDQLLYVGITNNPRARFGQHNSDKPWFKKVVRSTMEHFDTRAELEAAEIVAIQSELPIYNRAHSVVLAPKRIGTHIKPRTVVTDANRFPAPDAIATVGERDEEREQRLDELEARVARRPEFIPRVRCPECQMVPLTRGHDGLIKCIFCQGMWTPEELEARK